MTPASRMVCSACAAEAGPREPYPFRCPNAGRDDADHLMVRVLDAARLDFPAESETNPFLRYRTLLHAHHLATAGGMLDDDVRGLVEGLDDAVAAVDGRGFRVTPFGRADGLSDALGFDAEGGVWVKDETGNVSGSHKGRHLMGVAIHLDVAERLGLTPPGPPPDLAIASCGNAALAAAVVARAAGRTLRVFVPPDGEPAVLRRLKELEADVVTCVREPRERGDPTYRALRRALDDGALPFTCQGPENGLTVEGGETLAWEIVSDLRAADAALDRVFVQVGGGALASSVVQGFEEAVELDALPCAPRVHAVQTRGAFPLQRAYERVARRIADGETAVEALRYAARHRGEFMWPWEEDPRSVARGILDDETYDWRAVVEGMLATGGSPVVVGEDVLRGANDLAVRSTGVDVDPTGSAGLAGLISLRRAGEIEPGERVAVLFTGIRRDEGG